MLQDFPTRTEQEDRLLQTLNDLGSLQDSEDTDRTDGPGTVKRVVILSSTLGTGHLRAGQAIQAALSEKYSGVEVETFDFWSLMDAGVAQVARQSYLTLVQEYPELYERVFELDAPGLQAVMAGSGELPPLLHRGFKLLASKGLDTTDLRSQGVRFNVDRLLFSTLRWAFPGHVPLNNRSVALMRRILIHCGERVLANRLEKRLRKFKPDIIVATQMLPAALLSTIKRRGSLPVPILGVLVDWGVNEFYLQSSVDHYCVPHASIHGLQTGERFSVTGIPLMPGFRDPPDQQVARTKLGLDAKAAVVLVQGGGLGLHVIDITRALMRTDKLHVLVQAGNNSEANDALQELESCYPERLHTWAWTDEMQVFFRAADLVVGKPGGLTLAECLACGRPLLACHSIHGQESFNIEFLEKFRIGKLVPPGDLAKVVESMLLDRSELIRAQKRAWNIGQRNSAERIAKLIMQFGSRNDGC